MLAVLADAVCKPGREKCVVIALLFSSSMDLYNSIVEDGIFIFFSTTILWVIPK